MEVDWQASGSQRRRSSMINAKDAVRIALEYVQAMYKPEDIPQLTLEEVELSDKADFWFVTVSFLPPAAKSPIEAMTGSRGAQAYKVLKIDAETSLVHSMKMRTV